MEWILIAGAALLGLIVPEFIAQFGGRRVPLGQNIWTAVSFALIASYFAFK